MIDTVAEQAPLGGLERWLVDTDVTEVMVNAGGEVWIERGGTVTRVGEMRTSTLLAVVEQVLAPIGRRLDRTQPMVDARLADGSRICAVLPPVAVDGPCLSIRRFAVRDVPLESFTTDAVAQLLRHLVDRRANLLVSGATSSGKTTLLNSLAGCISASARVITLEDVAELRLQHPHVLRLETRAATPDLPEEVTLDHLVRTALRLRPDRLVVGEVRGTEALALLHALATGHDGSLATVHADGALEALHRLAGLVVQAAPSWPLVAVHRHVVQAIDVVVHLGRDVDGRRRVREVAEVRPWFDDPGPAVRTLAVDDRVVDEPRRVRR